MKALPIADCRLAIADLAIADLAIDGLEHLLTSAKLTTTALRNKSAIGNWQSTMNNRTKELKQAYKLGKRPMGVFLIRNTANDKVLVVSGIDLQGIINRHKFELTAGGHKNLELQRDWNELGSDKFEFEIVDQMEPLDTPAFDARRELAFMEEMWLEKLEPYGDRGYNERKLTREQRLKRITTRGTQDS